ncbi:annexin D3-like isoform X1 [Triticum dicoccoides]|uniref:annexin D3-like isoform X1 n=1 Tax=Triticum dicoccoides TaxID=85692 RepID=UPI00188F5B1F|nr:annexin D3-like isoform X1 [Triticum dicoccoides]
MCGWCCCLECIHNIPPLNLLFLHFSSAPRTGRDGEGARTLSPMASISVPDPAPSPTEDAENIRKAVQGWGTDENALIEILGHRTAAQRAEIAVAYEGLYDKPLLRTLQDELSSHFKVIYTFTSMVGDLLASLSPDTVQNLHVCALIWSGGQGAMTLWTMDPAARDAKLAYKALRKKGGDRHAWVLIEVACASSPDHLVAVRKAYCSAYDSSLEEDVAACPLYKEPLKQFLVRLVSSYRDGGDHVDGELARAEAAELHGAVAAKKQPLHGDVVRIVSSRSKPQLKATFQHYKREHGKAIDEVLEGNRNDKLSAMLKTAVWCLTSPEKHFAEVIRSSIIGLGTDEESLTRAIVSRAEVDLKKVKEEYKVRYKTTVTKDVVGDTSGYYQGILLTLIGAE